MTNNPSTTLISIVVPVYRNEGTVRLLYQQVVAEFAAHFSGFDFELIFVNDGSDDNSYRELCACREEDKRVKVISFSRNFGQIPAIVAGWHHATGAAVVNISADLQDPVSQITKMVEEWKKGGEIVVSYRVARDDGFLNDLTSKMFYRLLKRNFPTIPLGGFDFALVDAKVLAVINSFHERNRFYQGDIMWVGYRVVYLPYERLRRTIGESQYNFTKRFNNSVAALLNVSYLPIRAMSVAGICTALIGFLYAVTVVLAFFMHKTPFSGWAPIMIVMLIIGGVLMLMLGIIGEYIWRIYDELKGKPVYIIREKLV